MGDKYIQKQNYPNSSKFLPPNYIARNSVEEETPQNFHTSDQSDMASNFTGRNNYSLLSRPPPPVVLNLYQNNLPSRTSSMRHYNKFSNPHGSSSNLPPEVSEANLEDSKLQNELQSSAYTLTPVYIDANLKTMTKGLQLQQSIWLEQPAFKQVYTKIIKLIQLINSLNSKENTAISTTLQLIKTLLVTDIPYCLDQLKEANNTYINTLSSRKKDIEQYKDEITEKEAFNKTLQSTQLSQVEKDLLKAKKRREYQLNLERLSTEVLSKKSRSVYEHESSQELLKLEKSREELERWKKLTEIRQSQKRFMLHFIKELINSINNSSEIMNLQDNSNDDVNNQSLQP